MDDEGSGSDSENSEVQGSTTYFLGKPANLVWSYRVSRSRGSRLKITNTEIMSWIITNTATKFHLRKMKVVSYFSSSHILWLILRRWWRRWWRELGRQRNWRHRSYRSDIWNVWSSSLWGFWITDYHAFLSRIQVILVNRNIYALC